MNGGRGSNQPWEIRLGAVQVALLSGLSAGAVIGSYFMGFFAGQSFGFETSRAASSVEVAKLPIGDVAGDETTAVSEIYANLHEAALPELPEAGIKPAAAQKQRDKGADGVSPAVKMAQEIGSDLPGDEAEVVKGALDGGRAAVSDPAETRMLKEAGQRANARDAGAEKAESPDRELGEVLGQAMEEFETDISPPQQDVRILGGGKADAKKPLGAALEEAKPTMAPVKEEKVAKVVKPPEAAKSAEVAKAADSPTKVPTPKASGGLVKRTLPPGHFAQVAAPKKLADAEQIAAKLKRSGFPVVVEVASVQGVEYFRVLVGPEENKVQAERLVDQLGSERYISGKPFIRVVK